MNKFSYCFLVVIGLTACSQDNANKYSQQIDDLKTEVSDLKLQLSNTQDKLSQVSWELSNLHSSAATFSPSSKGYEVLHTNVGDFVASLKKITKYADGYKATFLIGNPNLITYGGITAKVHWGEAFKKEDNISRWLSSLKTQDIDINQSFLPGVWNEVTVTLSPAEAKETGHISLELIANQIYLNPDYRKHDKENE